MDDGAKHWPYDQIRQTQDAYRGEPVRLEFARPPRPFVITAPAVLTDSCDCPMSRATSPQPSFGGTHGLRWDPGNALGVPHDDRPVPVGILPCRSHHAICSCH